MDEPAESCYIQTQDIFALRGLTQGFDLLYTYENLLRSETTLGESAQRASLRKRSKVRTPPDTNENLSTQRKQISATAEGASEKFGRFPTTFSETRVRI